MEILRIETSHPHIAQRIAEFAQQLGAIVKMPKKIRSESSKKWTLLLFL